MKDTNRERIVSAFMELVKEEGLESVTVKEIAEHCGISRQTFYHYFRDKYEIIEYQFIKVFAERYTGKGADVTENLEHLMMELYDNASYYIPVISYTGQNSFEQIFIQETKKFFLNMVGELLQDNPMLMKYIDFSASGACGLTRNWVKNGMKESPEEVVLAIYKATPGTLIDLIWGLNEDLRMHS